MPDWKKYLREKLSLPVMKHHREERAMAEMTDHLEDLYREALSRGMSEEDALARALEWLGEPQRAAEDLVGAEPHYLRAQADRWLADREEDFILRGGSWAFLGDRIRELRQGLRALTRRPLFSGVSVLVLALGIGASTAIFTLVDGVILAPLPFEDPGRLVAVQHAAPGRGFPDVGQCAAWHFTYLAESQSFEELGMFDGRTASVTGNGPPERVSTLLVTDGVFQALRLSPVHGRLLSPDDMDPDGPTTVMLGYDYWQRRFGGDPSVMGRTLEVDGIAREVVGVAPADLRALGTDAALIVPLRYRLAGLAMENFGWDAVGRLKEGVTEEEAAADLNRALPLAWEKFPGGGIATGSSPSHYVAQVIPLADDLTGSVADILWILMGGVGVVLLIACANVANLFLVRAGAREGEMAVRTAMGASRRRVGWEYLNESLLLGLTGGVAGLILAQVALRGLLVMAPIDLPRVEEVGLDTRVLLFTLTVSLGAGLLFGVFPMLSGRRGDLVGALREGGRGGMRARGRNRAQGFLAVSQISLALVLLVAAGLMLRSFETLRKVEPGFSHPEEILTLRLSIPGQEAPEGDDVARAWESMVRRLEDVPGVSSVGLATQIPMGGGGDTDPFFVRREVLDPDGPRIARRHKWVGGGYLEAMEIPLLAGRSITWDDVHARAPVALLSERLAREVFGSPEAALGQFVSARPDPPVWKEVVGVVKDVREDGMELDPPALVYWPLVTLAFYEGHEADRVHVWRSAGLAIRSDRVGTGGFLEDVQNAIWEVNPNLPLLQVTPLERLMASSMARTSFTMTLLGIAGAVAIILGMVGVYGVISFGVAQRGRELGMRMALGAEARQLLAMVMGQGLILAGVGIILGLAIAFGVTRLMSALLFGVSPADPMTFGVVAMGLLTVTLLASYLPARRAARADPVKALRAE